MIKQNKTKAVKTNDLDYKIYRSNKLKRANDRREAKIMLRKLGF